MVKALTNHFRVIICPGMMLIWGQGGGGGGHRRGGDGTGGKSVSSGALVLLEWEGEGGCS